MVRRTLVILALAACSADVSSVGTNRQPIIRGVNSDPSQDYVIYLYAKDNDSACTGTLIAPNLVLTARHCVSHTQQVTFGCDEMGNVLGISGSQILSDHAPANLLVYTGSTRANAPTMAPDAVGAKIFHDMSTNLCGHDVSLILLDRDIPNALIAPIRLDTPVTVGETFTAVGWGVTDKEVFPFYRQQRANVKISAVGPKAGFDPTPPNDFQVGESICEGDSGGPALDTMSGAIIGVTSRGGNGQSSPTDPAVGCTNAINFYTQPSAYKDLILQAFSESGYDPWVEGGPDPRLAKFGEACTMGSDCRSSICATYKMNAPFCSQDCSADPTSCPMGYDCKDPGDGTQICLPHESAPASGGTSTSSCSASGSAASSGWLLGLLFVVGLRRRRRGRTPPSRRRFPGENFGKVRIRPPGDFG